MIKETITNDLKTAMKTGQVARRMTIGVVLSAIKNRELEKRSKLMKEGSSDAEAASALTDEEVIEVVSSEIKKRRESIATYTTGGRPELADKEQSEIDMLMNYMPTQMSEEEVSEVVKRAIAKVKPASVKDMGKVMAAVMPEVKGKADGELVSRLVKELMP